MDAFGVDKIAMSLLTSKGLLFDTRFSRDFRKNTDERFVICNKKCFSNKQKLHLKGIKRVLDLQRFKIPKRQWKRARKLISTAATIAITTKCIHIVVITIKLSQCFHDNELRPLLHFVGFI